MIKYCLVFFGSLTITTIRGQVLLTRGPYLQQATTSSVVIRWRTGVPTTGQVKIKSQAGTPARTITDTTVTTEHKIAIAGLASNTRYRYTIGTADSIIQGGVDNYFKTSPSGDALKKLRFWITGDCGTNSALQREVRDHYLNYVSGSETDGWLLLGDNAYTNGTDLEYQSNFFEVYQGNIMKNTILWPAPGNHDYANNPYLQATKDIAYYDIFTVPGNGEAGGTPSGSQSYYSFDVGNVHFVALDSYGYEQGSLRLYDTLSPQVEWLKKDLAQNVSMWTVAYWHHPPYTKGSHDSDGENDLALIRQNTLRVLERFNVDVVFCGHSHSYERTRLMSNHFDHSSTFDSNIHTVNSSSAIYDGSANSCPYFKNESQRGTVYVVAGSAGQIGPNAAGFPHSAMYYSNRSQGGSGILEVENNRLDFKWLNSSGEIKDSFTMMKQAGTTTERTVSTGEPVFLSASWVGEYEWQNDPALSARHMPVEVNRDSLLVVRDKSGCLADSIRISFNVVTEVPKTEPLVAIYPNPAKEKFAIDQADSEFYRLEVLDALGRVVMGSTLAQQNNFERGSVSPGVYLVVLIGERRTVKRKLMLR